jgi:hypothetical protein
MSEQLALGLTALAMLLLYVWANLWLARRLAGWLTDRTGPRGEPPVVDEDTGIAVDADEVIVNYQWVEDGTGHRRMRSLSRGEQRFRTWWFLLVLPLFGYLNYRFFDRILAGFEAAFQPVAGLIVRLFYGG